jgi:RND family efflux transporter MFP subunit
VPTLFIRTLGLVAFVAATLTLASCQRQKPAPPAPPPPKVTVSQPVTKSVTEYGEYTGYLDAVQRVEIRPRIRGRIDKVHIPEGTEIKEGTLLYEIDPAEYQVARDQAKAALDRAVADLGRSAAEQERAQSTLDRATRLRGGSGVSQEEYEQALANAKTARAASSQAEAAVEQAKAALAAADLNLKYTKIYAPISGRVSRTLVTEGNLVGYGGEPTQLTVMVDQDPIYVFFDVPERDAIRYEHRAKDRGLPLWSAGKIPVEVAVETETGYPHAGVLNFRDPRFEPGTGTIRLRGIIDNKDRKLSSGMFAKVRFPIGETRDRLMVPAAAVLSDQRGRYILVVGPDNVVQDRTVTLGPQVGGLVAIEKGLKADEWVIVNGVQKARPKAPVEPERAPIQAAGE